MYLYAQEKTTEGLEKKKEVPVKKVKGGKGEPEELDFMFDEELERMGGAKKKVFTEL